MPTEILSLTAMTLWPLALAVIVWLIASQSAKEADEIEKVVGALTQSSARATRDYSRNRRIERKTPLSQNTRAASVRDGRRLGPQLRIRRLQHAHLMPRPPRGNALRPMHSL